MLTVELIQQLFTIQLTLVNPTLNNERTMKSIAKKPTLINPACHPYCKVKNMQ